MGSTISNPGDSAVEFGDLGVSNGLGELDVLDVGRQRHMVCGQS